MFSKLTLLCAGVRNFARPRSLGAPDPRRRWQAAQR